MIITKLYFRINLLQKVFESIEFLFPKCFHIFQRLMLVNNICNRVHDRNKWWIENNYIVFILKMIESHLRPIYILCNIGWRKTIKLLGMPRISRPKIQEVGMYIVAATGRRTLQSKRGKPKRIVRQRNKTKQTRRRKTGPRRNALVWVLYTRVYPTIKRNDIIF